MSSWPRFAGRASATAAIAVVSLGASAREHGFTRSPLGQSPRQAAQPARRSPEATEALFRGDMVADASVGCAGPGPAEWATKVTAVLAPTFGVVAATYSVAGSSGPTWDLVAWSNGASPGPEIQRCPLGAANGTPGPHTVTVPPGCLTIPSAAGQTFFFGFSQGTDTNAMAAPQDTSGSTPNTVFIRNANCGLPNFGTVESIGFPGYWVHRIIVDDTVPVELLSFGVR